MIVALALAAAAVQDWKLTEQTDPMSDKQYATATLNGDAGSLVLKCGPQSEGELYVAFTSSSKYLGGLSDRTFVSYRFDDAPAERSSHWIMEDRYAYSFRPAIVHAFLDQLPKSKKVVLQVYNFERDQVNVTVQIPSNNDALVAIAEKCKLPERPK